MNDIQRWRDKNREKAIASNKAWVSNNKYKIRAYQLKREYGLTVQDVKQMFIGQNGMCAICSNTFRDRYDMTVDHDHATGKVRQLLCRSCNRALGLFKDNISTLSKAVDYLNKWKE